MTDERLFIVTYDISDQRRWRRVFKAMHGYGDWIQLSVFQCRLSRRRRAELETRLRELVKNGEDHVLLIDVGPAERRCGMRNPMPARIAVACWNRKAL